MSYKWILGLILLMSCTSSKKMTDQKVKDDLSIELISSTKKGEYFDFNFAIKNNTNKPVTILKHKGLKERSKNDVALAAVFYNMEYLPYQIICEEEPMFMDQQAIDQKVFKTSSDFITIGSKEKYLFNVKSEDYSLGICSNKAKQFKVVMKYDPKKKYFQKENFENRYKYAKDAQQYFYELGKTFQSTITSDTIIIKL